MSFLAPVWLALAAAIAIPLVLHLMRRRIESRVEFPAVRYLARAEKETIRSLKLRNLLLMALRVMAIVLLALAAARPIGLLAGSGHVPTAMAVVLDNSLSSGAIIDGAPLLNALKRAARSVIDGASPTDRVWLVTIDGSVVGGSPPSVNEAIDRTEVFGGRGDLGAATARAAGLALSAGLSVHEVAIVSDGQASEWRNPVSFGDVRVIAFVPATKPPVNHAAALADPRPPRWTPQGSLVIAASGADSVTYRVSLGERTLARGSLHGNDEVTVHTEPQERGWQPGTLELEPDELRSDDTRHFAVWIGAPPAVRVDPAAGAFARSALDALVQSQRATPGDAIEIASAENVARLPALILAPSDPVRLGAANRALERLGVPWRFGDVQRDETVARGPAFEDIPVSLRYPLLPQAGAQGDTLAAASGRPWIVAGDGYVILGSPLDPKATALPVRAQFVPWLADIVAQRLGSDAATGVIAAAPGAPIRLSASVTGLERDDGQVIPVSASNAAPARAGVYFLRRNAERIGALVVNPEPEESNLARLDLRDVTARIQARDRLVTADAGLLRRVAFTAGARRPLQTTFIVLALACLLAEMYVVRRAAQPERRQKKAA